MDSLAITENFKPRSFIETAEAKILSRLSARFPSFHHHHHHSIHSL